MPELPPVKELNKTDHFSSNHSASLTDLDQRVDDLKNDFIDEDSGIPASSFYRMGVVLDGLDRLKLSKEVAESLAWEKYPIKTLSEVEKMTDYTSLPFANSDLSADVSLAKKPVVSFAKKND